VLDKDNDAHEDVEAGRVASAYFQLGG